MGGANEISPLLYRYDVETNTAVVQEEVGHFCLGNGPCWSLDGSKFYFTDSPTKEIREFDYDIETSTVKGKNGGRVVFHTDNLGKTVSTPDGQCIDSKGNIWTAGVMTNSVFVTDPSTGEVVKRVWLKTRTPLSCCFGGPEWKHLLVTNMSLAMMNTGGPPYGGVALVTFDDDEIVGNPTMKMVI
jgi:sugar lactone lactonase YvrE